MLLAANPHRLVRYDSTYPASLLRLRDASPRAVPAPCTIALFRCLFTCAGADELLPILIYIVTLSGLRRPAACLKYIQLLTPAPDMCGELDYYITMFESALFYILELQFDASLRLIGPSLERQNVISSSVQHGGVAVEDISLRGVDQVGRRCGCGFTACPLHGQRLAGSVVSIPAESLLSIQLGLAFHLPHALLSLSLLHCGALPCVPSLSCRAILDCVACLRQR